MTGRQSVAEVGRRRATCTTLCMPACFYLWQHGVLTKAAGRGEAPTGFLAAWGAASLHLLSPLPRACLWRAMTRHLLLSPLAAQPLLSAPLVTAGGSRQGGRACHYSATSTSASLGRYTGQAERPGRGDSGGLCKRPAEAT